MARRRGDSGSTEWFGITGSINTSTELPFITTPIGVVPGPTPTSPGQNDIVELPTGTLLRTFGAIACFDDAGGIGSSFKQPFGALHHDEAVLDQSGTLNYTSLDITDGDNLGFEGLFWLGSCILWRQLSASDGGSVMSGCQMRVDSKAKRKLRSNDIIALDLSEITAQRPIQFSYHFRFLVKYS